MSFDRQHEIHTRRFGRNLGVGACLLYTSDAADE